MVFEVALELAGHVFPEESVRVLEHMVGEFFVAIENVVEINSILRIGCPSVRGTACVLYVLLLSVLLIEASWRSVVCQQDSIGVASDG